jgi:glucose/arabinose dehydrogenase
MRSLRTVGLALALLVSRLAAAQDFSDPSFTAEAVVTLPPFQVVGMQWADDGAMFIWQKNGLVRVARNGVLNTAPFLDFRGKVNTYDDRGMLGLVLDPNFDENGFVYLAYVFEPGPDPDDTGPRISRLTRVTANPANPDVMLAGSEVILIDDIPADGGGHTAGTLRFASDGTLFLANGDGATAAFANALAVGAQSVDSLRGKILRINPDGSAPSPPQVVNPFYDGTNSIRSKVWALGLRNAFRFDFHPTSGDVYACDVGWNAFEEVNRVVAGGNYGWPCYEGNAEEPQYQAIFPATCGPLDPEDVEAPLYAYPRTVGTAVVGGAFYTGTAYPASYQGNFFFSDYTGGWMRRLVLNPDGSIAENLTFAVNIGVPVSTEVGPDGLLYFADYVTGQIRRILYNGPVAVASAAPTSGYSPLEVDFSSAGSNDPGGSALTYLWTFGDGDTSTAANPTHTYTNAGVQTYNASLTVRNAANVPSTAQLSVTVGSTPPVPTILAPATGVGVEPGQTVNFEGSATDPDETLPASALTWDVLLHHNTHIHSHVGGTGFTGSFVAEYHGVGTYSYELILNATDSSGLVSSTSVMVPVLTDTTPPTDPTNLVATADGSQAIDLTWTASTDEGGVASYRIERCTGAACSDFGEIAQVASSPYENAGLLPATTYRYRVRAADATGNLSGYSNVASEETDALPPTLPGLVAAYGFDEGYGASVFDITDNNNDGTIDGATWTSQGRHGQALSFDGVDDVVVVSGSASLDLTAGMTLSAWVYSTMSMVSWKAIMQKEVDAYFLNANTVSHRVGVGGTLNGSCCAVLNGTTTLPGFVWTHVAGTYDGSMLRIYVNGNLEASQPASGTLEVNTSPLRIGGNTYSNEFFPGRIDDVRIYDRALSEAEIEHDMVTPVHASAEVPAVHPGWVFLALGASGAWMLARPTHRKRRVRPAE